MAMDALDPGRHLLRDRQRAGLREPGRGRKLGLIADHLPPISSVKVAYVD
jgi:hypothetical protein